MMTWWQNHVQYQWVSLFFFKCQTKCLAFQFIAATSGLTIRQKFHSYLNQDLVSWSQEPRFGIRDRVKEFDWAHFDKTQS